MPLSSTLSSKEIDKKLKKKIKEVIRQRGITQTTRKGSKELSNLTRRIAQEPFESMATVEQLGVDIGEKIAQATQKRDSDHLHQGAIRQLIVSGTVQALVTRSKATLSAPEEAAIDTSELPTEVESSSEVSAEDLQREQSSPASQQSEEESSELSSPSASQEDVAEPPSEEQASPEDSEEVSDRVP